MTTVFIHGYNGPIEEDAGKRAAVRPRKNVRGSEANHVGGVFLYWAKVQEKTDGRGHSCECRHPDDLGGAAMQ
jgi:hypothetical protein